MYGRYGYPYKRKVRDFMKKVLLLVVAALVIPSVALAKKPPHPTHGKSAPKVMYVLKGKLSNYQSYDSIYVESGMITILVRSSNHHGRALRGQTLTFPIVAKSRITLRNGLTTITDNDKGIVKVWATKRVPAADLAATLQAVPARQVIDQQGASS
jgi:hypothetical protein